MTRVIVFLFIFSNLCFAEDTCKDLGENIQKLNDLQNKALNIDDTVDKMKTIENATTFLGKMKNKSNDDHNSVMATYLPDSITEDEKKLLSVLHKDCENEIGEATQEKNIAKHYTCIESIKELLGDKTKALEKENSLKALYKGLAKINEESFKSPKVINLGIVKKSLAQKFLDQKCTEESSNKELSESQAFNYACRDQVYRPHTEGIKVLAEDSFEILLKLELKNNKVDPADLKKSCDELLKDAELKEVLSSCTTIKQGAAVVSQVVKKDPSNGGPTKPQTEPVDPTKNEFKTGGNRNPASKNKVVKEKLDPDSYKAKRARKRKKTWKTIGIVAAAGGAVTAAVWGLSKLFKPTPSTLEFTPHPNSLKAYNTQSYDMNAYQQYMMYQNYQSNQSMMYQNNLYQGSTYGYGNNWIGSQDSSASSPYTFEYGF